jgi:hypothetical protein
MNSTARYFDCAWRAAEASRFAKSRAQMLGGNHRAGDMPSAEGLRRVPPSLVRPENIFLDC